MLPGPVMAGLVYGLAVFAVGFVLGTLRELILAPRFSRDAVVLIEGPVILVMAWIVAGWIVRGLRVPPRTPARLGMGGVAFALVMAGEAAVAVFSFDRSVSQHLMTYLSPRGMLELTPQIAFALFPLLHLLLREHRSS